ncbi:putative exported protein [Gilliamella apicola]|uniref:TIGR03752 family integrating conjugative element protein n=1 Tax=Gilliamella apicola TaxID=1196095 RepID=UPI00042F27D8|nr:TIGR03752 family integrating conjugative element protein [Gilliamella apicola]AHN27253.1 putative exported protein [Gilliamella apicola]PXV96581.1 cell division protein ZapB [Gilliamella apicola]
MAKIKGNKLLFIIVMIFVVIVFFVIFIGINKKKNLGGYVDTSNSEEIHEVSDLSKEDLVALGITGDTEKDTVQTLISLVKTIRNEQMQFNSKMKEIEEDNRKLKERNNQLENGYNSDYKIQPPKKDNLEQSSSDQALQTLMNKVDQFGDKLNSFSNRETRETVGQSISIGGKETVNPSLKNNEIIWISPDDQTIVSKNNNQTFSFPTSFNGREPTKTQTVDGEKIKTSTNKEQRIDSYPFYTLPVNSTLLGSVSMTALLGRIPIEGKVTDPYPFKIVIGRDNLMANGIELPNVEGAIVSGTATGDYVLSCVRGNIKNITFVFDDGRITTIPKDNENSKSTSTEGIGWLSDEFGIPCISGDIKSNAQEYLATVGILGVGAAAADAFSEQNSTIVTDGSSVTKAITGSNSQYILGKGISGGIKETIDWFNKRYGQAFDAVYVPPGKTVAIHITKEIPIDYINNGRLVDYNKSNLQTGVLD